MKGRREIVVDSGTVPLCEQTPLAKVGTLEGSDSFFIIEVLRWLAGVDLRNGERRRNLVITFLDCFSVSDLENVRGGDEVA